MISVIVILADIALSIGKPSPAVELEQWLEQLYFQLRNSSDAGV
jgi:hypothetical protein